MTGRYGFHSISLDGDFGRTLTTNEYPQRGGTSGGYGEHVDGRSVEGSLEWALTPRVSAKLNGRVNLSQSRYFTIGTYLNPPVPRDQYDQSYRAEGRYTFSQRFNTALGLEVSRSLYVNIPAASTAANNEIRSYRADWRWTYHLLPGLTAMNPGGTALAFNPAHNSLFMVGHDWDQDVAEVQIPSTIVNSNNLNALTTATVLQPFGIFRGGPG